MIVWFQHDDEPGRHPRDAVDVWCRPDSAGPSMPGKYLASIEATTATDADGTVRLLLTVARAPGVPITISPTGGDVSVEVGPHDRQ